MPQPEPETGSDLSEEVKDLGDSRPKPWPEQAPLSWLNQNPTGVQGLI